MLMLGAGVHDCWLCLYGSMLCGYLFIYSDSLVLIMIMLVREEVFVLM